MHGLGFAEFDEYRCAVLLDKNEDMRRKFVNQGNKAANNSAGVAGLVPAVPLATARTADAAGAGVEPVGASVRQQGRKWGQSTQQKLASLPP